MVGARLLSLAGETVGGYGSSVAERVGFAAAAAVLGAVGAGFLIAAGYAALAREIGAIEAMLVFGVGLFVLAFAVWKIGDAAAKRRRRRAESAGYALREQLALAQSAVVLSGVRWAPLAALAAAFVMARRR